MLQILFLLNNVVTYVLKYSINYISICKQNDYKSVAYANTFSNIIHVSNNHLQQFQCLSQLKLWDLTLCTMSELFKFYWLLLPMCYLSG